MLHIVRRNRRLAAALAAVAGVILLVAVVLNEQAVRSEAVGVADTGSYPVGAAALLAFAAAWLALRSANGVPARGVGAPVALIVVMVVIALIAAFFIAMTPILFNALNGACLAGGSKVMLGAAVAQGACENVIQPTDFPVFYPSAVAAVAGAALGIASTVLLIRARTRRDESV